jgi:hypothetical protein
MKIKHKGIGYLTTSCKRKGIVGGGRKGQDGRQLVANDKKHKRDFLRCSRWQAKPLKNLQTWQMRNIGSRFVNPKLDNI